MRSNAPWLALCLCLLTPLAHAAPIDNPGNYVWSTGSASIHFNSASPVGDQIAPISGQLDMDLDSAGNITFNTFTIASVTLSPSNYTVLVQVLVGGSSGTVDASIGGYNSSMSLQLRIKVTGNGLPTTCLTPSFTRPFEALYSYDPAPADEGELLIYSATGGSTGAGWVAVPALPTTSACGTQGATLNSLLGFDGVNGGLKIDRLRAVTVPGPQGS